MKKNAKVRLLIADDHYIVRLGLIALVSTEPDLEVVAEAADGAQAVELFAATNPDLALLDLSMPVKGGIQATIEILARQPSARVLMLTAFDGDHDIYKALQAGALGYILKSSSGQKLIPAVRAVAAGQRWMPKEIASRLAALEPSEQLTAREIQVLKELAKGLANKQIADVLAITEYTAKDHLKSIMAKLQVADRTEAVTAALQRGIIHL